MNASVSAQLNDAKTIVAEIKKDPVSLVACAYEVLGITTDTIRRTNLQSASLVFMFSCSVKFPAMS